MAGEGNHAARDIALPTSPIKPNILQPASLNACPARISAVKLLPQVMTASADSTGEENCNISGQKKGIKKKRQGLKRHSKKDQQGQQQVPFVKHHHSVKKLQTPTVSKRNARERNRVRQVNTSFTTLRNHIPHLKNKTSKVDTLRAAVEYIQALQQLIGVKVADEDQYNGPILITEAGVSSRGHDDEDNEDDQDLEKSSMSCDNAPASPLPLRPLSALGLNPQVYQLPPPTSMDALGLEHLPTVAAGTLSGSSASPQLYSFVDKRHQQQHHQQQVHPEWWAPAGVAGN